tara:strand:+ start:279 stop:542 length:264 start_codon:yes stop_codon:yes gene_type:complete
MKIFIYKILVALFFLYIFFEITIGSRIDYFTNKINMLTDHQSRLDLKNKLKDEMKKGIEKDNYFTQEERILISNFINKIKKELTLND